MLQNPHIYVPIFSAFTYLILALRVKSIANPEKDSYHWDWPGSF